jgi:23S rRNA-/tRNA-specific pseudouridylate synthase
MVRVGRRFGWSIIKISKFLQSQFLLLLLQLILRYGITKSGWNLWCSVVVLPTKRTITTATREVPMATSKNASPWDSKVADAVVQPNEVALVWKYTSAVTATVTASANYDNYIQNEPYFHVSLQPIKNEASITSPTTILSIDAMVIPTPYDKLAATVTHPSDDDDVRKNVDNVKYAHNNDNVVDTDNIIPEAVLIYERQLRKVQHAKKTSQPLSDHDLHVIYADEHLVVINKPAGVLTVPGVNGNPSILDLVYQTYGVGTVTDPAHMIVHRLDMDTSGIIVFARSLAVAKLLHAVFRNRLHISKQYECLVMGHLVIPSDNNNRTNISDNSESAIASSTTATTKILIDLPIQRDHIHPPFMRISTPQSEKAAMECVDQLQLHGWKKILRKAAKPSQTIVLQILEHGMYHNDNSENIDDGNPSDLIHLPQQESSLPYTRLRLEPITGRTHQLRVHW